MVPILAICLQFPTITDQTKGGQQNQVRPLITPNLEEIRSGKLETAQGARDGKEGMGDESDHDRRSRALDGFARVRVVDRQGIAKT
jgi:hypothetical protein